MGTENTAYDYDLDHVGSIAGYDATKFLSRLSDYLEHDLGIDPGEVLDGMNAEEMEPGNIHAIAAYLARVCRQDVDTMTEKVEDLFIAASNLHILEDVTSPEVRRKVLTAITDPESPEAIGMRAHSKVGRVIELAGADRVRRPQDELEMRRTLETARERSAILKKLIGQLTEKCRKREPNAEFYTFQTKLFEEFGGANINDETRFAFINDALESVLQAVSAGSNREVYMLIFDLCTGDEPAAVHLRTLAWRYLKQN